MKELCFPNIVYIVSKDAVRGCRKISSIVLKGGNSYYMKLLNVDTVAGAITKMDQYFKDLKLKKEEIDTFKSLGRIAGADVYASCNLPEFSRSTVDGYALLAKDTFGASDSLPVFLKLHKLKW